jgi:hypothetical protein
MRLEATSNARARVDMLWLWLMRSIMRLSVRVRVNVLVVPAALKHASLRLHSQSNKQAKALFSNEEE